MKKKWEEFRNVESEFFDIDEERKIAILRFHFASPEDLMDVNSVTKIPVLNDEFSDWIQYALAYTPRRVKIDIDVSFSSMDGYTEEGLFEIFRKNVGLEAKKIYRENRAKKLLAYGLIGIGLLFFLLMLLLTHVFETGLTGEIIGYVSDIATTVAFWEALTILLVENRERKNAAIDVMKRFHSISFRAEETPSK